MSASTSLLLADTDPDTFAAVTGLAEGHGFIAQPEGVGGLYPHAMADRLLEDLRAAGVGVSVTPAATVREGRRRLAKTAGPGMSACPACGCTHAAIDAKVVGSLFALAPRAYAARSGGPSRPTRGQAIADQCRNRQTAHQPTTTETTP